MVACNDSAGSTGWRRLRQWVQGALALVLMVVAGVSLSTLAGSPDSALGWAKSMARRAIPGYSRFGYSVEDRLAQFGPLADRRLRPWFERAGVAYPPQQVVLLGLKREREVQVYAGDFGKKPRFIRSYPVRGASGGPGPKLRQGDKQVPEGIYGIESLNPNSRFHVSLRVSYPSDYDRERAREDGRTNLGGDIMIHGGSQSTGCLAVGDTAAEDLFVLVAHVGEWATKVVLSPWDFRSRGIPTSEYYTRPWVPEVYADVRRALLDLDSPG